MESHSTRVPATRATKGRAYPRIVYGPDYAEPDHMSRLRKRGLVLRESALRYR